MDSNGDVWAWGDNSSGQLGNGTYVDQPHPAKVPGLSGAVSVSAGDLHSLAVMADGTVQSWGANASGQLGDNTTVTSNVPVSVTDLAGVISVVSGRAHNLALLIDGSVLTWGDNSHGQLGDGTTTQRNIPVAVSLDYPATGIGARGDFSFAHPEGSGGLWLWGDNAHGRIGDGTTTDRSNPMMLGFDYPLGGFAAGSDHVVVLMDYRPHDFEPNYGSQVSWGNNAFGQLGNNTYDSALTPNPAMSGFRLSVVAGDGYTLAIEDPGIVHGWGRNEYGQLGDGTVVNRPASVVVATSGTYVEVAAGVDQAYGITDAGIVYAWGRNHEGQLGDGTTTNRETQDPVLTSGLQPFSLL